MNGLGFYKIEIYYFFLCLRVWVVGVGLLVMNYLNIYDFI